MANIYICIHFIMFRVRRNWRFQRTIPTSAIHVIWSQEYQVRFDRGMSMHFAVFLRVRQKSSEECARFSTPVLGEQSHSLCLDYWMCLCIQHVSRVELAGQQVHIISSHLLTFALAQFSKKSNTQEKPYFSLHMLVSVWNLSFRVCHFIWKSTENWDTLMATYAKRYIPM